MVRDVEREWIAEEPGPGCHPVLWILLVILLWWVLR
jgi:hypothetical protein